MNFWELLFRELELKDVPIGRKIEARDKFSPAGLSELRVLQYIGEGCLVLWSSGETSLEPNDRFTEIKILGEGIDCQPEEL